MKNLLIDADMLAFRACSSCEHEVNWGNDLWTLHSDIGECQKKFEELFEEIIADLRTRTELSVYETIMCFTDKNNFRKLVLPSYKSNRKDTRKPVAYAGLVKWVRKNHHAESRPYLEADDLCSLLSKPDDILVSADKDFQTIPNRYFYNYHKQELMYNTQESADRFWLYQCLSGDITDGYTGLRGYGPKTVDKLFREHGVSWETVVGAYELKGMTEEDALQQAHVARILREGDYRDGMIYLWNSNKSIDTKGNPVVL